MTGKPMTLDEHKALGAELLAMRERLGRLAMELDHAVPKARSRALAAQSKLDELRSVLDDVVFQDHPNGTTAALAAVYYPRAAEVQPE